MHTKGLKWGHNAWNRHEMKTLCMVCLSLYLCVCVSGCVCLCVGAFCNHWYGLFFPGFPPDVAFFSMVWRTHWCGVQLHINVAFKMISSSCLVLSQILEVVSHNKSTPQPVFWDTKVMNFEFRVCWENTQQAQLVATQWRPLQCFVVAYCVYNTNTPQSMILWHTVLKTHIFAAYSSVCAAPSRKMKN